MTSRESGLMVPSNEIKLPIAEVDQQAFDLIGKFMFTLRGIPAYTEALADMYENETARIEKLKEQRGVGFYLGNRHYSLRYEFLDGRKSDYKSLRMVEEIFSKDDPGKKVDENNLIMLSRRLQEQKAYVFSTIVFFSGIHDHKDNPSAVEQAGGMLRRLSS